MRRISALRLRRARPCGRRRTRVRRLAVRIGEPRRPREGGGHEGLPRGGPPRVDPGRLADPGLRVPGDRERAPRDGGRRLRRHPRRLRDRARARLAVPTAIGSSSGSCGIARRERVLQPRRRADRARGRSPRARFIGAIREPRWSASSGSRWSRSRRRSPPGRYGSRAPLVLVLAGGARRRRPGVVWRRARLILPLVLFVAVFVPFVRGGETVDLGPFALSVEGLETFATVSAKATLGIVSAVLLGATTTFPAVLAALESMRVPRLFVLIAAFTYRYLFVIVDEVQRMRAALASRAYRPRNALHAGPVGRAATALFLRTYARGERVYLAMLARGYDGTMRAARAAPLRTRRRGVPRRRSRSRSCRSGSGWSRRELRRPSEARPLPLSATARPPSPASTSTSSTASASRCSARTAPARRRSSST